MRPALDTGIARQHLFGMCLAALKRVVVLLVLTFLSGVSVQAAPMALAAHASFPTTSVFNDGRCTPLEPACPLSGLAGCVTAAGCLAAVADTSGRLAQYTPQVRGSVWYAMQPNTVLGLPVKPDLFPPIPFA
jgi:hypothetical protein